VYVPDQDEWICAVCGDPARAMALLRSLLRFRMGNAHALDSEGDEFEDADFDDDELGVDTDYPEDR
jgi:hypothetical protein